MGDLCYKKLKAVYILLIDRYLSSDYEVLYETTNNNLSTFFEDFVKVNLGIWIEDMTSDAFIKAFKKKDTKILDGYNFLSLLLRMPITLHNLEILYTNIANHVGFQASDENISYNILFDFLGKNLSSNSGKFEKDEFIIKKELVAYEKYRADTTSCIFSLVNKAKDLASPDAKQFLFSYFVY